jgi:tetraacyldisaccharide 4'-kinase
MSSIAQEVIQTAWRRKNALFYLVLTPLSWLFALLTSVRRFAFKEGFFKSFALPVPVIVVGNINVGGSGKTPVVMWLVAQLAKNGYHPAVISRGYGGNVKVPTPVNASTPASLVGDEPVLIKNRCDCPVWVGADRVEVANALLKAHPECNVIISDDGLQHYRLKRDVEIAVVDAEHHEKNARLLPAGQLREPLSRLKSVDAIVCNGQKSDDSFYQMQLVGERFYNLVNIETHAVAADFKRKAIKAIAGIGKPARFFEHLRQLGMTFVSVSFDDHYAFSAEDLAKIDCDVLIMTEKDAVKCRPFAQPHHWVLPVEASIDAALLPLVLEKISLAKLAKAKE